jgi:hypothetical protein
MEMNCSGFVAMKSSLFSRNMWASLFAIVLMLGVTVAPLSAEAMTRIPLLTRMDTSLDLPQPGDDDMPTLNNDVGEITCFSTRSGGSVKRQLFRGIGGKTGQLRSMIRMAPENRLVGYSIEYSILGGGLAISDDDSPRSLRHEYDAHPEYRIKNTSALRGRPRNAGGMTWTTLLSYGKRSGLHRFRFESGYVLDEDRGHVPIIHATLPEGASGTENRSFNFNCRI